LRPEKFFGELMSKQEKTATHGSAGSKPPRPVLIASQEVLTEYSIFLEHFLVGLADESVLSALVCPADFDVGSIVSPSVEIIRFPAYRFAIFRHQSRRKLLEQLKKFRPTVLHSLSDSRAMFTMQLAGKLDIPYVLTAGSLQRRFSRFSIGSRRCSRIITPAQSIAANIGQALPGLAERIEQINIGTFVAEQSNCLRHSGRVVSMVTAYRLSDTGGLEKLLGAVRHLAIDGYKFMLVITGSGRAEMKLRKLLAARGLSQIAVVVPKLQPRRRILAAGDIFIQPQVSSSFNPVLLEAMSLGMAVAGCKGGVDDLIIDGKTAVVFDPADEISIYDSLRQLLDRQQWARQLAAEAQNHLVENYSVSRMISSVLGLYRQAQEEYKESRK